MNDEPLRAAAKRGRHLASSSRLNDCYSPAELEFLKAMDGYKRAHNRPNPTCCEVLAVLISLGYRKGEPHG